MTKDAPTIICMTPVKNEAWILERFIRCTSRWADHIIIADQGSDDGSRQIAARFSKVTLIDNESESFNEPERQKLLIDAARKIEGPRVLIALDADEFFVADFIGSTEWQDAMTSPPGTVLEFRWACVLPDRNTYYVFPADFPLGYVDDGAPHEGKVIHSPRVPVPDSAPRKSLGVKVLHLSVLDSHRFRSKTRWYQAWEYLNKDWNGREMELYRFYHRYHHINDSRIRPLPPQWIAGYGQEVDLLNNKPQPYYRWDKEMLHFFDTYGTDKFRRLNVWDVDWNRQYERIYGSPPSRSYRDPRSRIEKLVHWWMSKTQKYYSPEPPPRSRVRRKLHKIIAGLIRRMGW